MKKIALVFVVAALCATAMFNNPITNYYRQNNTVDSTGNPGDHLDLYGTMDMFKQSESMQSFEKSLNAENAAVNNLDLNKDGEVDYVRVVDHSEKGSHAVALQVAVNEKESQDVASIQIEKTEKGKTHIQMVGDEAVYGKGYIVEPPTATEKKEWLMGPADENADVSEWKSVKHIYSDDYKPYVSPYGWKNYPSDWKSRKVVSWAEYAAGARSFRGLYQRTNISKLSKANKLYSRNRIAAPSVIKNKVKDKVKDKAKDKLRDKIKKP